MRPCDSGVVICVWEFIIEILFWVCFWERVIIASIKYYEGYDTACGGWDDGWAVLWVYIPGCVLL